MIKTDLDDQSRMDEVAPKKPLPEALRARLMHRGFNVTPTFESIQQPNRYDLKEKFHILFYGIRPELDPEENAVFNRDTQLKCPEQTQLMLTAK